jgi:hypothetical protein
MYPGVIQQCLISSPSDVPPGDLQIIHRSITWWNGWFGSLFGTVITPISWGAHAAAEFGEPPQEALNRQIVDKCDICIAIFRARLGTRTKGAESGTAEEIERLSGAGKYVAVLRCQRKVDLQDIDLNQLADLDRYLLQLKDKALIINYKNDAELAQKVQNILNISVDHMQSVKGA